MNPATLQLDAGNSRLKWRLGAGSGAVRGVVDDVFVGEPRRAEQCVAALVEQLQVAGVEQLHGAQVCSVRDAGFRQALEAALQRHFSVSPRFAASAAQAAGVRNGYAQPASLGVDRWLALLAARAQAPGAVVVLDCGTTMTLDVVDAGGQHLGGYIVPGLRLQQAALAGRSGALQVEADWRGAGEAALQPGRDTASAIGHGILNMALGFVNFQHRKILRLLPEAPHWYLCGGDATLLAAHLEWEHRLAPDLVLDGLTLALPESSGPKSRGQSI